MTPQLMQAIKLLQLSNLDLAGYVEGELERNPLLERTGEGEGEGEPPAPDREAVAGCRRRPIGPEGSFAAEATARPRAPGGEVDDVLPDDADAATSRANGEAPAGYSDWAGTGAGGARRTATTISKPSSRPRPRSPTISPSSSRWRWSIRRGA